jgi:micrococcal nuclease
MPIDPKRKKPILGLVGALCAFVATTPVRAAGLPACAGGVEIARARVVRVEQNGVIVLSDGRALLLEGIRLPMGAPDHAPKLYADQARDTVLKLAQERPLTGTAIAPKQDSYDRVRVQAFAAQWLQQALLEQGLARVAIGADRGECAAELYEFEASARKAGRGIWASSAYRVRNDRDDWRPDVGTFQIVEGQVGNVVSQNDRILLNFGADGRTGLVAMIASDERRAWPRQDIDFAELKGRRVRVRGLIQNVDGRPQIALSNPAQVEVLN